MARNVLQSRKPGSSEATSWLCLISRYLVADRFNKDLDSIIPDQLLTHAQAARNFESTAIYVFRASDVGAEDDREIV